MTGIWGSVSRGLAFGPHPHRFGSMRPVRAEDQSVQVVRGHQVAAAAPLGRLFLQGTPGRDQREPRRVEQNSVGWQSEGTISLGVKKALCE